MDEVVIALGSNAGDRHRYLCDARQFLATLSKGALQKSPIYLTEPVGPSSRYFLNAVVEITTELDPHELLKELKSYEEGHGRDPDQPRWSARTIDLDIISCRGLVIQNDNLIIPHPEYTDRLFVLKPLRDINPGWRDPATDEPIEAILSSASRLQLRQTSLSW
jgi:2-amino-4-hydroxy-6-hydroxymethyldihydropteridine diphosphokinase